jgi:spore maturation protein CgeB
LAFFDNEDCDINPNKYIQHPNIHFFKRNYDGKVHYEENVYPFPFIMFGKTSLIEKIDRQLVSKEQYLSEKTNRVFYTGGLYQHIKPEFGVYVDRGYIYNQIHQHITNPGALHNDTFMEYMRTSKFSVDLLGAGNPNIRTFEILVSGSLLLQQKNDLVWIFPERFSDECFFTDGIEFENNLQKLNNNKELYNKCLQNQYEIVHKYFNKEWLKQYILSKINV